MESDIGYRTLGVRYVGGGYFGMLGMCVVNRDLVSGMLGNGYVAVCVGHWLYNIGYCDIVCRTLCVCW